MICTSETTVRMIDRDVAFPATLPITVTIRSLRAQNEGAEVALQVLLESGEHREHKTLVLTMEQYCDLHPTRGVISEELYERLEEASLYCKALRSGENLLSYGANSAKHLAAKLVRRGYPRELSATVAAHLCEVGLIDEDRDMRREVEKCLRKLWGAKRISAHLWSRGFDSEVLATLPELLAEVDFVGNCAALIQKHYGTVPTDPAELRRITASLSRYGYSLAEIRAAMRSLS